mgnify:CR=1 FL=1
MAYLVDTHALLFFLTGNKALSPIALKVFEDKKELSVSIVSFWEIAIKQSLGKLDLTITIKELEALAKKNKIETLEIKTTDIETISQLEHYHRDPFDRMLIAQAINNELTLVSKDKLISKYPVKTLW